MYACMWQSTVMSEVFPTFSRSLSLEAVSQSYRFGLTPMPGSHFSDLPGWDSGVLICDSFAGLASGLTTDLSLQPPDLLLKLHLKALNL